ncbi:MAG TPA: ubiquitin-like small modifier protein 1 [Chloroflexota bacterium]|nr:ubiquitin-like small modifier protein 1 [Chloroflexota bacterium]
MAVTVRVPTPLRRVAGGNKDVQADGATVSALIDDLEKRYPGFKDRLCDDDGSLKRFINLYVNGEDIRYADGLETSLKDGDEVSIIPAVSGG